MGYLLGDDRGGRGRHRSGEYGQSWMIVAALLDGPLGSDQLAEHFRTIGRRFSVSIDLWERERRNKPPGGSAEAGADLDAHMRRSLDVVVRRGWAVEEDGLYHITESGREQALVMLKDMERARRVMERATQPETVSKAALVVHLALAAVKLPAALISGSVGLLNDSLDTLMDGISSAFVFLGVKTGRERLVSYILLAFMAITGGVAAAESIGRLIRPTVLSADLVAFVATAVSAVLCSLLWLYQKYSGLKHRCVPLIAQSLDSRNHLIVAGGVTAGLIAAYLRFPLLDGIVGLSISILILKGAVQMLVELLRSGKEGEIDLSRYGFTALQRIGRRQMTRWLLYEIDKAGVATREELMDRARAATDCSRIRSLEALGFGEQPDRESNIQEAVHAVFESGWVSEANARGGPRLRLTDAGERELDQALARSRALHSEPERPTLKAGLAALPAALARLVGSAAFVSLLYVGLRWVIGFLPPWDVWRGDALIPTGTHRVGPFAITGAQLILAAIGVLFVSWGRRLVHDSRHRLHHARERGSSRPDYLVVDGVYSRRRHPMYAGFMLTSLGVGLGLHSGYALAWAGLAALIQITSALVEERKLRGWFGKEYQDYARRASRRFLPWWGWLLALTAYAASWIGL